MATQVSITKGTKRVEHIFNSTNDASRYASEILNSVKGINVNIHTNSVCLFSVTYHKSVTLKDIETLSK